MKKKIMTNFLGLLVCVAPVISNASVIKCLDVMITVNKQQVEVVMPRSSFKISHADYESAHRIELGLDEGGYYEALVRNENGEWELEIIYDVLKTDPQTGRFYKIYEPKKFACKI